MVQRESAGLVATAIYRIFFVARQHASTG